MYFKWSEFKRARARLMIEHLASCHSANSGSKSWKTFQIFLSILCGKVLSFPDLFSCKSMSSGRKKSSPIISVALTLTVFSNVNACVVKLPVCIQGPPAGSTPLYQPTVFSLHRTCSGSGPCWGRSGPSSSGRECLGESRSRRNGKHSPLQDVRNEEIGTDYHERAKRDSEVQECPYHISMGNKSLANTYSTD